MWKYENFPLFFTTFRMSYFLVGKWKIRNAYIHTHTQTHTHTHTQTHKWTSFQLNYIRLIFTFWLFLINLVSFALFWSVMPHFDFL